MGGGASEELYARAAAVAELDDDDEVDAEEDEESTAAEDMTTEQALAVAKAEGLHLLRAPANRSGYRAVTFEPKKKMPASISSVVAQLCVSVSVTLQRPNKRHWPLPAHRKGKQLWLELSSRRTGAAAAACRFSPHHVPAFMSMS